MQRTDFVFDRFEKILRQRNGKRTPEFTQFQRQSLTNVGYAEGKSLCFGVESFTRLSNLYLPSEGGGCTCIKRGCICIKRGCTPIITLIILTHQRSTIKVP